MVTVVGFGVGVIVVVDNVVNDLGDELYNSVVKPAVDWWSDTCNGIGDWRDTLWW